MKVFQDSLGRSWSIKIDVGSAKRACDLTGINILDLGGDDGGTWVRLGNNPIEFVDVLFALVKPQADQLHISDVQFGESIVGDVMDHAWVAFTDELVDFFPPSRREALRKAVLKLRAMNERMAAMASDFVDTIDVEQEARTLFDSLLNSRQSLASGRTIERSEN